jgi:hypothetical protein
MPGFEKLTEKPPRRIDLLGGFYIGTFWNCHLMTLSKRLKIRLLG